MSVSTAHGLSRFFVMLQPPATLRAALATRRLGHSATGALVVAIALGGVACDDDDILGGDRVSNTNFVSEESFSFRLAAGNQSLVTLEGISGNIEFVGVAGSDSFIVEGERQVGSESIEDAEAHLDELQVEVSALTDELRIRTDQPQQTGGRNYVVNYKVEIPADLEVSVVNLNGNVNITSLSADLVINDINGNITLEEIVANVAAALTNGNITGGVTLPSGGTINMATVNGNITLEVPENTSAAFLATLTNGTISLSGLEFQEIERSTTRLRGTIGGGDGDITLGTVNGNIQVSSF